jgi:hypothetical protein
MNLGPLPDYVAGNFADGRYDFFSNASVINQIFIMRATDSLLRHCGKIKPEFNFFLAVFVACLSGCAYVIPTPHYVDTSTPAYDPAVSARVRILSSTGTERTATFWPGDCYKSGNDPAAVRVNDGFFSEFKYSSRSVVIGMSPSPRKFMQVDGLFGRNMIREYVVPAGKPMTLALGLSIDSGTMMNGGCAVPPVTFTPAAEQDYDIFLDTGGGKCWAAIRHIDGHGMDDPVPVKRAPECHTDPTVVPANKQ